MSEKKAIRVAYGEALAALGEENEKVVVLDADLAHATMTATFANKFPQRFFNAGIAEANMIDMAAANYKLDNLTVFVDNNGLQIDGTNDQVMSLGDLSAKFASFGYQVIEVADGNDLEQVQAALDVKHEAGKPKLILCHTVKGKGVSFMENQVGWHGKAPNAQEREQALAELEG